MAALVEVLNTTIFVNFDHPDGSTSWGYILLYFHITLTLQMAVQVGVTCDYMLVKFHSPDGSIDCIPKYYIINITNNCCDSNKWF